MIALTTLALNQYDQGGVVIAIAMDRPGALSLNVMSRVWAVDADFL